MPKHSSQLLTLFALLIFAVQSFANGSVLCKMATNSGPHSTKQAPLAASQSLLPCHTMGSTLSDQAQHSAPTQSAALQDCFYCANKLCNTSIGSAFVASNALTPFFSKPTTTKPNHYSESFSSTNISAPYRPPILA
ncbi:hypothetical protein [Marinagarivorans algicola]|uniref:hypothetical protein n=1 Tax=Marinagarivorans algicola TaxID=1513270 RepID=UPI0006B96754|nr:hypothetical protein [Marinagarivorans algicola]